MVDKVIGVRIDAEGARRGARQVRAALNDIQRTGKQTTTRLKGLKDAIFSLKGAFASLGVGLAVRGLVNTATNLERVERGLKVATGSAEGAAQAMEFLAEETDRLGINLESAEGSFVKLAAAAKGTSLEGKEANEVFLGVAEASAALGLTAEQTGGALTAIEQIISKGTVSAEELRGQLGERLPGAFQIAARAVGTSTEELGKWLQQGKLASEDFIPLFARQLRMEFGGAAEEAADSLQGAINRMENAWLQFKRVLAESGALEPVQDAIEAITRLLEDEDFLEGAAAGAEALGNTMKFLAENIDLVVIALKALLIGKAAGFFANLGVGAFNFAAGLTAANRAALTAAAATQGLARASAAATAGMTALRGVGLALGGPVGILVGIAAAAVLMASKFKSARTETKELREELENLGKTPIELETSRLQDQIKDVETALEEATRRRDRYQATIERGPGTGGGGFLGTSAQEISFAGATGGLQQAQDDVEFFTEKLEILKNKIDEVGESAGGAGLAEELAELQAALSGKLGAGTDKAADAIDKARDSLTGMEGDLQETVDTFGKGAAAVLEYRLTQGDLADEVAALGDEGITLREKLIRLAQTYEKLEGDAESAEMAQATFADLYDDTRTSAEQYADELERLDALYLMLSSSTDLTAEQLAQLPEIFERLREEAAKTAEGAEEPFDAMTEFAIAAARSMQSAMSDLFFSVMQGEFDDLAGNFKRTIDRMVADFLASQLLNMIAQAGAASGNPFLAAIGTVVQGTKQQGGGVRGGQAFLVGERGPEIFLPAENGEIIPNRTMMREPGMGGLGGDVSSAGGALASMTTAAIAARDGQRMQGAESAQDAISTQVDVTAPDSRETLPEATRQRFGRNLGRFAGEIDGPGQRGGIDGATRRQALQESNQVQIFGQDPSMRRGQPEGIQVTDYATQAIEQGAGFDMQPNTEFRQNINLGLGGVDGRILEKPGSGNTGGFNRFPGRAGGGQVMRGQAIVAGENGPEMFVGSGGGGGGGGAVVNMTINTPDANSFRQSQGQVLSEMNRLLQGARIRNG